MRSRRAQDVRGVHGHPDGLFVIRALAGSDDVEPVEAKILEDARRRADVSAVARLDEHEANRVPSTVEHRFTWHYAREVSMRMTVHGFDGPPVVKLAGIVGGIHLYNEEVTLAARAGFRVAALDVTGDRRDDPTERRLGWDVYADEVAEAIDRLPASRAVLWGTSFGCLIALAAAARHPEHVSGLLLSHPPDPLWRPRLHLALFNWVERRAHPDRVAHALFSMAFLGLTSWEAIAPALWVRLLALLRASLDAATPPATVRRKLELLFREEPGLPPQGAAIPVEIIAGAWDLVAPLRGARRLASRIPGAKLHVLGFSGHAGAYARPRAHHDAVIEALKRLT